MALTENLLDGDIHPIDLVESVAEYNEWDFDRIADDQIAMAVEGQWRTYSITLAWSSFDETLRLICSFEMEPPSEKQAVLFELLNGEDLITVHQEHSARVVVVDSSFDSLTKADAIVTNTPNLAISVLTADCLPVLFADKKNNVIGVAHAGWKGALNGVLENTVHSMATIGADVRNIKAAIGPCISPNNYEVGQDFFDAFIERSKDFKIYFSEGGEDKKYFFNLPKFALDKLRKLEIAGAEWIEHCTYHQSDKFYSYRRSQHLGELDYGRQISSIKI